MESIKQHLGMDDEKLVKKLGELLRKLTIMEKCMWM